MHDSSFLAPIQLLTCGNHLGQDLGLSLFVLLGTLIFSGIKVREDTQEPSDAIALETAKRLTRQLENLPMAVIEWDRHFRVCRWSTTAEKIFGWQADEVLGLHPDEWQFVFAEDQAAIQQAIAQLMNGKQSHTLSQNRNYTKQGSVIHCQWYNSALLDESGNFLSVLSFILDVTERQQAETELRQSKEQLEIILHGVADGITVQDTKGLLYANDAAARLVGYPSVEAFLETSLSELMQKFVVLDERGQPFPLTQLPGRLALQGQQTEELLLQYRLVATGEERWSLVKATPVFNEQGQVQFVINIFHDITERKQAEDSQRFLAEASALLATSLDYQITLENLAKLAVPRLADWCAVDMVDEAQTIRRLAVVHVDPSKVQWAQELQDRYPPNPEDLHGVAKVLRTGESEWYPEIPDALLVTGAQDEEHLAILRNFGFSSAMVVPLKARGRTLGAITFVFAESGRRYREADVRLAEDLTRRAALAVDNARLFEAVQQELTERKRVEEALRTRAAELAHLSKVLTQTNTVLEKRNQELDQFAYIVSHDLKAPLRAIDNLSHWIEEDLQDHLNGDTQRQMSLLRGRVQRMDALINGLLQYSRVGRLKSDLEVVDVNALLADVVDSIAPPASFAIAIAPEMPILLTERLPLEQVFTNLLSNAIKHHNQPDGQIQISVQEQAEFYEFAVSDNGPGIAPEDHERVFGIFQTLKARDQAENTGVGLAIVKKILEDKGGTIRLDSQEGQGATFYFTWQKNSVI